MRLDSSLNSFTRDQVEKNILANSKELEKEVVSAIEEIKTKCCQFATPKEGTGRAAFDNLSETKIAKAKSASLEKFNQIKKVALDAKKEYEDATLLWMSCKSSYSLFRVSN